MSDIGAEVGQKMRLAIKAKLTELNIYVDDELPDYIMVMIANKRTKAQMKEDLSLFLSDETSFFVEWLHIVLKKLKEVHVTNPNVFKNPIKRKSNEYTMTQEDYKKIKKEEEKIKREKTSVLDNIKPEKSLTDDLPITASKLSEVNRRKIVLIQAPLEKPSNSLIQGIEDDFDIPLLSEINASNEEELQQLEKRIKDVKSRLGLQVESDDNDNDENSDTLDDGDCLTIKPDPGDMEFSETIIKSPASRRVVTQNVSLESFIKNAETERSNRHQSGIEKRSIHTRITFDKERDSLAAKYNAIIRRRGNHREPIVDSSQNSESRKRSILDRLGKRSEANTIQSEIVKPKSIKPNVKEHVSDCSTSATVSRVGIMSKVSIPMKTKPKDIIQELTEADEMKMSARDVASVVKVKPRKLPARTKQANPNLLFKAVAEAQRSVHQTTSVGIKTLSKKVAANAAEKPLKVVKSDAPALFTKKYKEQLAIAAKKASEQNMNATKSIIINRTRKAKLMEDEKLKLRVLLSQKNKKIAEIKETKRLLAKNDDELVLNDFQDLEDEYMDENEKSNKKSQISAPADCDEEDEDIFNSKTMRNVKIEFRNVAGNSEGQNIEEDGKDEESYTPDRNQQFIVTLDGIEKLKFGHDDLISQSNQEKDKSVINFPEKKTAPMIVKTRRTPSPIVFDRVDKPVVVVAPTAAKKLISTKKNDGVPANLPLKANVKKNIREKCKYYPGCRQGNRCEYLHPSMCKLFPNCKFAEQCLYAHPVCKFETSCTRKSCPYSHSASKANKSNAPSSAISTTECKFFPNCSNASCPYFHPKMCKYGLHCKNQLCVFQHPGQTPNKLSWRPDK